MYKTETHLHTRPVSACAHFEPEAMIGMYKEAGYTTVFVSDHLAKNHFAKLGDLPWREKIDLMYNSYLRAKAEGEKHGMHVLFSPELSLGGNHYLLYGVSLSFLYAHEQLFEMTMDDFCADAKAHGIFIVQAHPLRDGCCHPHPEYADAFEVINSNPRHQNFDVQTFAVAKQYGKPMTAGSDAHRIEDVAGAAVVSGCAIETVEQYLELLLDGKLTLIKHGVICDALE